MRMNRCCLALSPLLLVLALPLAQAQEVSASKLGQALSVPGLQAKAVPKRRPQQPHQDYDLTDSTGKTIASAIEAPVDYFAQWQQVPGFEPLTGVGQAAFSRPDMDQVCARSAKAAACITLMPMAFPNGKKPTLPQLKAALQTLI